MSGTPNPSLNIRELNGNLTTIADTGEGTILKIGVASAYIRSKPIVARQLTTVNRMGVGPLVSSAGPHIEQCNRPTYLFQVDAATPGAFGAIVKHPIGSPASPSSMTMAAADFSARSDGNPLPGGAALDVTTGWAAPPSPLPLAILAGVGTVAHTARIDYVRDDGVADVTSVSVTAAGTFATASGVRLDSIIRYRTLDGSGAPIDPVGTTALTFAYAGPLDRFDHLRFQGTRGGQITVSGGQQPQIRYSFDDGITWSPSVTVPSSGLLDLYTYPGGFTRWHTGIRASFAQGTVDKILYGAYRAAGAAVNGDTVWTFAQAGASIEITAQTVPAPLQFSNVGSAVKLQAETSGGTAASYNAFGGNLAGLTFAASIVGAGGNAITISTVNDGGTGNVTGAGTNALVIHYTTGVTTVANVKANFPVAALFSSVTATGGTDANILVDPGDTHGATNLAGGTDAAIVTTALAAKAFFDTDTSPATLAAKTYINSVGIVGNGLALVAVAGPGLAPDGALDWTAKKPGVRVRQIVGGNNTAESISVAGLDVTFVSATDGNGAQISTPNSALVTLANSAAASSLVSAAVGGSGAGIVGAWASFLALPVAIEAGDEWTSYTTPPKFGLTELSAALQTLKSTFIKTLANVEHIHLVQDDCDNLLYQAFETWLKDVKTEKKIPLWGTVQGLYRVTQTMPDDLLWAADFVAALPSPRSAGGLINFVGGEQDTIVTLYGSQMQMSIATLDMARCMNVVISQSPNQTQTNVLTADGTQFAIPGTGLHVVAEGTEEQQALWESDDALLELHAQNVTTNRTLPEYDGVFIRQTLNYVDDGNDFIFWERRRVMNRAFRRVNRSLIVMLNANVLTDPSKGTLAEVQAQQIERRTRGDLNNGGLINDNGVNHVSGFAFTVSRVEQTARTLTIAWSLTMVPLAKVLKLDGTIGFAITISDTFSVGV